MITLETLIFLISFVVFGFSIYFVVYVLERRKENTTKPKKINKIDKKPHKISYERYEELTKQFAYYNKLLSEDLDSLRRANRELMGLIRVIKDLDINLNELEELGLHRYNAKYGKRDPIRWGLNPITVDLTTFISNDLYETLKKYGFIGNRSYTEGIYRERNK